MTSWLRVFHRKRVVKKSRLTVTGIYTWIQGNVFVQYMLRRLLLPRPILQSPHPCSFHFLFGKSCDIILSFSHPCNSRRSPMNFLLVLKSTRSRAWPFGYCTDVRFASTMPVSFLRMSCLRTRICLRNLCPLLVPKISANRWHGNHNNRTRQSDCDRVEVCGLVNGDPMEVTEGLLEEERGGRGHGGSASFR